MTKITVLPYEFMQFVFVSDFYDTPLKGLCKYEGNLCWFEVYIVGSDVADYLAQRNTSYSIFKLTLAKKLRLLWRKFLFEQCVGYHCTYKDNKRRGYWYYRRPVFLYKLLHKLYYWRKYFKWKRTSRYRSF